MENATKMFRIGEFSEKVGCPISTVRYYIKLGLIIPTRVNGQFLFNDYCLCDMQRIKFWKKMGFSLNEIHELISLYRKYPTSEYKSKDEYKKILIKKRDNLIEMKQKNEIKIRKVETMLNQLPFDHKTHMDELSH